MEKISVHRNRLANETSPYLLQHARNPVDWYPWGMEALEAARASGKPILLSIGYSACHWCHVMAHESFEDEATAKLMNELFVNIKVDREERPDIDKIYQVAQQLLTQHNGGWPLTMFLTHDDQRPFFGGTYFPDRPRHGMPAFAEILQRVAEFYDKQRDGIRRQNESLMEVFTQLLPAAIGDATELNDQPSAQARTQLTQSFDKQYGGFGSAPKFPHPTNIEFLLRQWRASAHDEQPDLQSLYMATLTLTRMAEGGIYDQLGGGFCRYSVDQYWMIPHFEKMLYDNGPLLAMYANAAIATGDDLFKRIANETADWIIRDMQSLSGGFWSTLDADSEGHEGKFYAWHIDEIRSMLSVEEYAAVEQRFGLNHAPNFEGAWHFHVYRSIDEVAQQTSTTASEAQQLIDNARTRLLAVRNRRVWPGRDEKILVSWNALAIKGMAIAARALHRDDLAEAAMRAIDFIRHSLWQDNRLLAVHKDGQSRFAAYLDDYAFLLDALVESLQTKWRTEDLTFAVALADSLLAHFADNDAGGFYFTADDAETLIHRPKSFGDEAVPAGNGIAAVALNRLGYLLGETRYIDAAEKTLRAAWLAIQKYPSGHASLLIALEEQLSPLQIIILRGDEQELGEWQSELAKIYAPRRMTFAIPTDTTNLPTTLAEKKPQAETVGYVCHGPVCSEPLKSIAALIAVARE